MTTTPDPNEQPGNGEDREDLPPKPPINEPMPSDDELEDQPEPGEEEVSDEDFLQPDEARDDPHVDDQERNEGESTPLEKPDNL